MSRPRRLAPDAKPLPAAKKSRALPFAFFIVAALGLAARYAYFRMGRESPFAEPLLLDPQYYHEWAKRLASGVPDKDVFYGLPFYPYFLAWVYRLTGFSVQAAKVAQHLLSVATLFFAYKTAEKWVGPKAGLAAAALAAFYGPLIFHEGMLIPEAIGVPLYAAAFYAACLLWESPSARRGVFAGALLGLAALTKAGGLLVFSVFLAALAVRETATGLRRFAPCLFYALTFAAAIFPVTLHNAVRGGDFVLLTSHGGFNFYAGNQPGAEGVFKAPPGVGGNVESQMEDSRALAERAAGKTLKPSEVSRYWSDRAWEALLADPSRIAGLSFKKILLFFDARELSDLEGYRFAARFNPFLKGSWPDFALLGPLVFMGLASFAWIGRRALFPSALWLSSYVGAMVLFFVNARYRLPMLGLFFPVAGAGLVWVSQALRRKGEVRRVAACVLAALIGAGIGGLHLIEKEPVSDYVNAGDAFVLKKDYDRAGELYREALAIDAKHAKANLAMAVWLDRTGRYDEARAYYLASIESEPTAQALNNLGMWHDRRGEYDRARGYFEKALELKPSMAIAHNNLGMVYGKEGRDEDAIREFRKSLERDPKSPRAHTNLGVILYRLGRHEEARFHWEEALRANPQFEEARRALTLLGDRPSN